jgi:flagellar hook-associated protein 1 FlgK
MSLTSALQTARSSLAATSVQTSVISRNIAGANDPAYSRKLANLSSTSGNTVSVTITRATDKALFESMLNATSRLAGQQALQDGLNQLEASANNTDKSRSPSAMLGALGDALQTYSASPNNPSAALAVVSAASDVVGSLNDTSMTVQSVRTQADADMQASVNKINSLLTQFQSVNTEIVGGSKLGDDITDALDQRDNILSQLSEEIGITTITRSDNSTAIYTDSGVTLFETSARTVSFTPTPTYTASTVGNAVYVDGVPVTGSSAVMPISSGKLYGLATLRDDTAVQYQNQLDEIARGLIDAFAESDQSGSGLPDLAGLFTYSGGPALPGSSLVAGLASKISVNTAVDPNQGGNLDLLRDGGINGSSYSYNTTAGASYTGRIEGMITSLSATRTFDPSTGLATNRSLADFANSSIAWLEAQRQATSKNVDYQTTILDRASTSLSNITGVNIDDEMAAMLNFEHAYQASSKLISAIDSMLSDLMDAIR